MLKSIEDTEFIFECSTWKLTRERNRTSETRREILYLQATTHYFFIS